MSHRFHEYLRARPEHPTKRRPVLINTWEVVYFRQDLDPLVGLAKAAAEVGALRLVLDDGWFAGRRNDHAGFGDWYVDGDIWPAAPARSLPKYRGSAWISGCGSNPK